MGTLQPPDSGVTVRMYRQGLGDCFLLAFPTGQAGQAFYMLIDCGVVLGTPGAVAKMKEVATDIAAATGGDIHLLVTTHEHWDHLSGFIQARDVFQQMRIHNLWLAWTEDPTDKLANQLREEFHKDREALRMAVNRASDPESVEHITNLLHFFGNPPVAPGDALGITGTGDTGDALNAIRDFASKMNAPAQYRRPDKPGDPGDKPLPLPQVNGLPDIAGVRLYVLGPPHDEKTLKRINPTTKGQETYDTSTEGSALAAHRAFFMAMQDESQLSAEDRERSFPFDKDLRIPRAEAKQYEFFQTYYGFDDEPEVPAWENTAHEAQPQRAQQYEPAWRRIDDDFWLESAGELALQLDSYTNNTSLAFAIELVNTKKVLLFVADAQIGSWLSWDDLSWSVPDASGTMQTIRIGDLLARTVLYKVGHHGSHNATIRGYGSVNKGLELMTSQDLVAMIPVNHQMALKKGWGQMPFDPLLQRLEQKTGQRVLQIDDPYPKSQPDGMSDAVWQAFKASFEETNLYMQYTVTD
jgi:hypothetical protein